MKEIMSKRDPAALAHHLREDHVVFDRRFDDLCLRARNGDWRDLDEVWGPLADDIEAHLVFEEVELFPAFCKQGPECQSLVDELMAQHREIRRLLEVLGLEIQLKVIRSESIDAFTDLMRKHAALEDARVYPWITRQGLWGSMQ